MSVWTGLRCYIAYQWGNQKPNEGGDNRWHAVEIQILGLSPVVDWDEIQVGGEALGYVVAQAWTVWGPW